VGDGCAGGTGEQLAKEVDATEVHVDGGSADGEVRVSVGDEAGDGKEVE